MKQRTAEDELHNICKSILKEIEKWKKISQNGCNDPAWPDGANMNLLRNHIIYYKTSYMICVRNVDSSCQMNITHQRRRKWTIVTWL